MLAIHRHGHGLSGRRNRPSRFDVERAGVYRYHLIRVFEIVVDRAHTVGDSLLRGTAQGKGCDYGPLRGIDNRAALGVSVEDKHTL